MPNAFQPVAAGAHNQRSLLAAFGAVGERGQVVAEDLKRIKQIVEILDFGNRSQAAHGQPDALSDDGSFADARVEDALLAIFFLQALIGLIYAADMAYIFTKSYQQWIFFEKLVEVITKDFTAGSRFVIIRIAGSHRRYFECRKLIFAVKVRVEALAAFLHLFVEPFGDVGFERVGRIAARITDEPEGAFGMRQRIFADRLCDACQVFLERGNLFGFGAVAGADVGDAQKFIPLLLQRLHEVFPGFAAGFFHPLRGLLLDFIQLFGGGDFFGYDPFAHFFQAIIIVFPL